MRCLSCERSIPEDEDHYLDRVSPTRTTYLHVECHRRYHAFAERLGVLECHHESVFALVTA